MSALPKQTWTPASYLAFECGSDQRHEYLNGKITLLARASANHNLSAGNTYAALHQQVLSPSTESYDRGKKFQLYRTLDTLQEYILISQSGYRIEKYLRQSAGEWLLSDTSQLEAACELSSIGCTLALADVYEKVTLETETKRETDDIQTMKAGGRAVFRRRV